jgi:hypothetical protein
MSEAKQEARPRAILSKEQAIEIFRLKTNTGNQSMTATSIALANEYNVNPKTIRDIWSGRSWFEATSPLWQQVTLYMQSADECLQVKLATKINLHQNHLFQVCTMFARNT